MDTAAVALNDDIRVVASPLARDEARIPKLTERHPLCPPETALPMRPAGGAAKRVFDLLAASMALILLSPALLLIAVAIRIETPGPALFRQRRGGYRGRTFLIFKFRTMRAADDGASIPQAQRNDPRVTRFGAILRRASLDELPQLFNVVRGEMSIVGPRPHAVAHDEKFEAIAPNYRERFKARPGITGLAQISRSRGPTDTPESVLERLALDIDYVRGRSFLKDMLIVLRTVPLVFRDARAF